jgi:very-short-patch-repair endonuclease
MARRRDVKPTLRATKLSRQEAARRGGQVRMARLRERLAAEGRTLGDYQRAIRAKVSAESCARNGAKGARVTIERHGYEALHGHVVRYRLAHPSRPEQQVMAILDRLGGVAYEREAAPLVDRPFLTVDFFLAGLDAVIEVNGHVHDGDPLFDPGGRRAEAEAARLQALHDAGLRVLVVDHRELREEQEVEQRIRAFLQSVQLRNQMPHLITVEWRNPYTLMPSSPGGGAPPTPPEMLALWKPVGGYCITFTLLPCKPPRRLSAAAKFSIRRKRLEARVQRHCPLFAEEMIAEAMHKRPDYYGLERVG